MKTLKDAYVCLKSVSEEARGATSVTLGATEIAAIKLLVEHVGRTIGIPYPPPPPPPPTAAPAGET